jgi:isopentenyl-diphosphate delta-isomerase
VQLLGTVHYRAEDAESGLVEHEVDHVLLGRVDATHIRPQAEPSEVADWCWAAIDDVRASLARSPERYTPWFPQVLAMAHEELEVRR